MWSSGFRGVVLSFVLVVQQASAQCGAWQNLSPPNSPPSRLRHVLAYDISKKNALLFGGTGIANNQFIVRGDTWTWSSSNRNWEGPLTLSPAPTGRYGSSGAYDASRRVTVIFGGANSSNVPLGDTWEFDGSKWKLRSPSASPQARVFHSIVYDTAQSRIILFGGISAGGTQLHDTWSWDGTNWSKLSDDGPESRSLFTLAQDTLRSRTVLFGGYSGSKYLADTWELDGNSWSNRPKAGPSARIESTFTFVPSLGQSLLFGGLITTGAVGNDTWTWDGGAWQEVQTSGPSSRRGAASTFDPQNGGVLLFGGTDITGAIFGDTWLFSVPDEDKDGVADCEDGCPSDPLKTIRGVCGCGIVETSSGCVSGLAAIKPKPPSLKMKGKKVHVSMRARTNVRYVISYVEVKKGKSKPKAKSVIRNSSTLDVRGLKKGKRYAFTYRYQTKSSPAVRSQVSPARNITIKY